MPFKRTYRRKYTRRPKKSYRRRFRKRTTFNRRGQRKFLYTRYSAAFGTLSILPGASSLAAYQFSLNDVPNYTEFTSLYDMYKINAVKVSFIPQQDANVSLSPVNNAIANARFFSAIDYNDATAPTTVDELREYKSAKWTTILRTHTRYIHKPKILDGSGYSISPWMATTSPSTNYYGLKVAVEDTQATITTGFIYKIECKFYMSFKQVK